MKPSMVGNLKSGIVFVALVGFRIFAFNPLLAQTVGGKAILTGLWRGNQVEYVERQIIVGIASGKTAAELDPLLERNQATIVAGFNGLRIGLLEVPVGVDIFRIIKDLSESSLISYAEPNMVTHVHTTDPNDPYYRGTTPATYPHQYALKNTGQTPPSGTNDADIDAPEAWDYETGSPNILIAILDTGIPLQGGTLSHPDLDDPSRFLLGEDFIGDGEGVRDKMGHGSHVAGIAGAETFNLQGIAGVSWNSKILVFQVFDENGNGTWWAFNQGVYSAVELGAHIINYSGGGPFHSRTAEIAVHHADQNGRFQSYSAGNSGSTYGVFYPARYAFVGIESDLGHPNGYTSVVSVAATEYDDNRSSYSSYTSNAIHISVAAPGGAHDGGYPVDAGDIFSTMPNYAVTLNGSPWYVGQTYGYLPGTSMAAPHVSGLAALILSRFPSLSAADIRNLLEQSAEDINSSTNPGEDKYIGHGRINAFLALAPPETPTGFQITGNQGQNPTLQWNANSEPDLKQYNIYRKVPGSSIYTFLASTTATQYTDNSVTISRFGDPYCYKIDAEDLTDQKSAKTTAKCVDGQGPVGKVASQDVPRHFALHSNHPNPFNPVTTIKYDLPENSSVTLKVYNLMGQEIRTLVNGNMEAGYQNVMWDGKDSHGNPVSSGMYLYRLDAISRESDKEFHMARKMVLLR